MRLVRQLDIIDKAAASGEKAHVLHPADRLANAKGLRIELLAHGRSLVFPVAHVLVRKPVSTFREHALPQRKWTAALRP